MKTRIIILLSLLFFAWSARAQSTAIMLPPLDKWICTKIKEEKLNRGNKISAGNTVVVTEESTRQYMVGTGDSICHLKLKVTTTKRYDSFKVREEVETKPLELLILSADNKVLVVKKSPREIALSIPGFEEQTISPDTNTVKTTLSVYPADMPNIRQLNKQITAYKKNVYGYISIHYTPAMAYRSLVVRQAQFADYDMIQRRENAERMIYGYAKGIQGGFLFKRNHTIFLEGSIMKQGFSSKYDTVDLLSGSSSLGASPVTEYSYKYMGIGIGYNYCPYKSWVNPVLELSVHYMFGNSRLSVIDSSGERQIKYAEQRSMDIQARQFIGKAGFGVSVRPSYAFDIRLMPVFFYNFTTTGNSVLANRLFNIGISCGMGIRFR